MSEGKPMSDDLVKHLRNPNHAQAPTLAEPMMKQAAARIEALEAENARLRATTDRIARVDDSLAKQLRTSIENNAVLNTRADAAESALESIKVELGETKLVLEQTERNAARVIAEAVGHITDLANDLAASIVSQYDANTLDYPVIKRRYGRDMEPVESARAFVQQHEGKK